ncbi:hypothetical protein Trco_006237 [Trichoderma cornu-damae]|uniref:Uncharacterized protein n=1 Tax=Trichoderma cornu-damae TaxID=654480 RepID=A0A9P8QK32_9HYPO|nr:hypothetical protein Trco_006237 [Trichoderma cornu-damae]
MMPSMGCSLPPVAVRGSGISKAASTWAAHSPWPGFIFTHVCCVSKVSLGRRVIGSRRRACTQRCYGCSLLLVRMYVDYYSINHLVWGVPVSLTRLGHPLLLSPLVSTSTSSISRD